MLKMLRRIIGENIKLLWKPGEGPCPVMVDPSQIDQLLANLCVNAKDSINGVGQLIIETGGRTLDKDFCAVRPGFHPGRYVLLTVRDNGCGMESETLDHIFEPFFTTKELGKGTGLGLATVYGMVKQNKGFIDVVSTPGLGTTFTVYLPRHDAKQEQPDQDLPAASTPEGRETILLVEDEPVILEMTSQMLKDFGYTVLKASSPGEAIRLAREYSGSIHLLLTDVVMPEMNGRNLARILLSLYPEMKRLFMSGYTADVIAHHGVLNEGVAFIQKPFSIQDLGNRIRGVLEGED
jgi:CheY-like chemotaxis protein